VSKDALEAVTLEGLLDHETAMVITIVMMAGILSHSSTQLQLSVKCETSIFQWRSNDACIMVPMEGDLVLVLEPVAFRIT
jgi:hypothetical protein